MINCVKRKSCEALCQGFSRVPKLFRQNSEIDKRLKFQWNTIELISMFYLLERLIKKNTTDLFSLVKLLFYVNWVQKGHTNLYIDKGVQPVKLT
jgi:hypothetical protein